MVILFVNIIDAFQYVLQSDWREEKKQLNVSDRNIIIYVRINNYYWTSHSRQECKLGIIIVFIINNWTRDQGRYILVCVCVCVLILFFAEDVSDKNNTINLDTWLLS
jgi:hypothetical protein